MLPLIKAEGDARGRGQAIGRGLGELVDRSLAFYRGYLEDQGLPHDHLRRALAPHREASKRRLPRLVTLLDGLADGAEIDPLELFAVNALEELDPLLQPRAAPAERCTTFTAVSPGTTILAHSEHWLAGDADNVALVVELPDDGSPPLASATVACCLPAVGMNGFGAAQGIDSLSARDDRPGVPRVLVSRHSLESANSEDAIRRAGLPGRAGGYAHILAFPGGETLALETSAERLAVLDGPGWHTNHYLAAELSELEREPSEASRSRHDRLAELLRAHPPTTPEDAMTILRDDGLAPTRAEYATLFAIVCEVESRRMWVAAGDPRECDYEEVDLAGVV